MAIKLMCIIVVCIATVSYDFAFSAEKDNRISPDQAKKIIYLRSKESIEAIKMKDMNKLATIAHPTKGIRFSPYSLIIPKEDIVLKTSELKSLFANKKKYVWGSYDGSGEPIELTFKEYFERFIYNKDFISAKEISYNKILGHGNTLNNVFEIYPNSIVVEYHFSGFDSKLGEMDWKSLRLIFEKLEEQWYLVGIAHDEWTI